MGLPSVSRPAIKLRYARVHLYLNGAVAQHAHAHIRRRRARRPVATTLLQKRRDGDAQAVAAEAGVESDMLARGAAVVHAAAGSTRQL